MSRQTILVIGAAGFIGRHTVARLVASGHTVYATFLPHEGPPALPGVNWLPCDLTKLETTAIWPSPCDSLIYLAQSPAWRIFPGGATSMFQVNVAAALRCAEYARGAGVQSFIFASSGSVYTQTTQPAQEKEPFDLHLPRTFYAASKLAAELLLGTYTVLFRVIIVRLFMPYGRGQDPKMLIPQLVQRVREGQPIQLHGERGLQANPVAVADVAEVLERCLALDTAATLNVAGPEVLTLRQMGNSIGRVLGLTSRFEIQPDQVPPVLVGDTRVLRDTLGWAPPTCFEAGLKTWLLND